MTVLAGERLTAYRESAIIQDKNYPRTGAFPAAAHEGALDYLTMQNQEQQDELDRALKVPISTQNFAGSMPLPIPGRALKINQDGSGFEMSEFDPDIALTTTENFRNEAQQFATEASQSASAAKNSETVAGQKVNEITTLHSNYMDDINTTSTNYLNQINSRSNTIIKDADAIINRVGLNMFDPVIKDHLLTYPDGQGLALQGTWVYRDAKAGERYGYPDFYNRCVKEFKESTTASENNVTVTGTVTNNNGVISGFSSANYAQIPDTPTDVKSFEMVFKFHTPVAWGNASQVVFGQGTNNNFQTPQLSISNTSSKLWIGMSSDGAAWTNVADSVPVALDTTYYVKALWSNGTARAYLSTTKNITEEHLIGAVAMDKVMWTVPLGLGYDQNPGSTLFTGSIDLNECYININGSRWWDGVRLRAHSNGHVYYPISAKSSIDSKFSSQGAAWYYGVDEANKRIFLPRNNWFMQMASSGAGNFTDAGLPNHKHYEFANVSASAADNGTISLSNTTQAATHTNTGGWASTNIGPTSSAANVGLSSNPTSQAIYGKSSTVQPKSVKQLLYICVGNQVQTDSWVDTITQVKNGAKEIDDSVQGAIADVEEAKDECIAEIGTKTAELTSKMAFSMFDTILKDHELVYPYDQGFALQGTYVYHDADPGIKYGYPDFYNKCVEEAAEAKAKSGTQKVTLGGKTVSMWIHNNGHMYYDISIKSSMDDWFNTFGTAWFYGIDYANKRIFLPRNNWFEQGTSVVGDTGKSVDAGLPNITGTTGSATVTKKALTSTATTSEANMSGSFYCTSAHNSSSVGTATGWFMNAAYAFDASRSSAVYGKSSTVQPRAVKKLLYICVGNRLQDTSWIDVATQVNNGVKDINDAYIQAMSTLQAVGPVLQTGSIMTGSLKIRNAGLDLFDTRVTKGVNPSATSYNGIRFNDANSTTASAYPDTRLGVLESVVLTDGKIQMVMAAYQNKVSTTVSSRITLSIAQDGTTYCDFPKCTTKATTTSSARSDKVAVIVQNYLNGTSWYRIWSDGWVEQGGYISASTSTTQVNKLLIKMANANYHINITAIVDTWSGGLNSVFDRTVDSFKLWTSDDSSFNSAPIVWEVKGYKA